MSNKGRKCIGGCSWVFIESIDEVMQCKNCRRRKVGRPKAINPFVFRMLLRWIGDGETVENACRLTGIGRQTYYDEFKRNRVFRAAMCVAREKGAFWAEYMYVKDPFT